MSIWDEAQSELDQNPGQSVWDQAESDRQDDSNTAVMTLDLLDHPDKKVEDFMETEPDTATDYFDMADNPQSERDRQVETMMLSMSTGMDSETAGIALEEAKKQGFIDTLKQEWTDPDLLFRKAPIAGGGYGMYYHKMARDAATRLMSNDYKEIGEFIPGGSLGTSLEDIALRDLQGDAFGDMPEWQRNKLLDQVIEAQEIGYTPEKQQAEDQAFIDEYFSKEYIDKTFGGKVATGMSVLPTWMTEFWLTGGFASVGKKGAEKTATKILGQYAKTRTGKLAIKAAGWGTEAAFRTTALAPRVGEKLEEKRFQVNMGLVEEEGWATSLAKAWGDIYIESLSETAGEGITKGLGAIVGKTKLGSRLVSRLQDAWMSVTGGTSGEFARKMLAKGGYSNIIGEIGEERLGTILRAITNVEDFGAGPDANVLERLAAGLEADAKNFPVEVVVLGLAMGGQVVVGQIYATYKTLKQKLQEKAGDVQAEEAVSEAETKAKSTPDSQTEIKPADTGVKETPAQIEPQAGGEGFTNKLEPLLKEARKHSTFGSFNSKMQEIKKWGNKRLESMGYKGLGDKKAEKNYDNWYMSLDSEQKNLEDLYLNYRDNIDAIPKNKTIEDFYNESFSPSPQQGEATAQIEPQKPTGAETKAQKETKETLPPGLTKAEMTGLSREQAAKLREKQAEGQPVGFKAGQRAESKKVEQIRRDYRAKRKSIENVKQELVDYARQNLPLHERGKMLAQVKNVTNQKQLNEAIDMANRLSEQYNQRTIRGQIDKELKKAKPKKKDGVLKGKFTADIQEQINTIAEGLKGDRVQARQQMVDNAVAYEAGQIDHETLIQENDRLSMVGYKDMTADELGGLLGNIQNLKATGKTIRQQQREERAERIGAVREAVSGIVTGGKGLKPGSQSLPKESTEAKKGIIEKLTNWQYGWDSLMDKLSKFDKTSKPFESVVSEFGNVVHDAEELEAVGIETWTNEVIENIQRIFETKNKAEVNDVLNELNESVTLDPMLNADGVEIRLEMTRDQLIKKYMELQDPTLAATFEGGIDKNGNPYGMRWTPEIIDAVESELTPNEKRYALWQLSFYRKYYNSVNAVYRHVYGVDLPFNEYYSPIGRDIETETPESVLLAKEAMQFASTVNGSLKSRQGSIKPLKFTASTQVLTNHLIRMEHFKAWTGAISDLRRVFGNHEIRRGIEQYHGRSILKTIDGHIEDMARGGIDNVKRFGAADKLRINFTKSVLGIKPLIALKQIPSVMAYSTEMPVGDFVSGVSSFWANPVVNYRTLVEKSPALRKRYGQGFERDVKAAMQKDWSRTLTKKAKASDWFFALIRAGDRFATMQGAWAKYQSELKAGKSDTEAIKAAVQATNRTQPTSDLSTLSAGQRGGSWVKLMTMFQNQPNKYFRIIANNARNIRFGRGSPVKAAANITTAWVLLPALFQLISDGFRYRKDRQLRAVALGPLNNLLILGSLARNMIGWGSGEMFDYQSSPVVSTVDKAKRGASKILKDDADTDDVIQGMEYLTEAAGQLAGIPTPALVQAEKAIRKGNPELLIFSEYSLNDGKKKKKRNYVGR